MNRKEQLKDAREHIERVKKAYRIMKLIFEHFPENDHIWLFNYGSYLHINAENQECFKIVKRELKKIFPDFKYKLKNVEKFNEKLYKMRYTTHIPTLELSIDFYNIDDMPKGIFKDGKCGFKKVQSTDYVFACEAKNEN